MKTIKVQNGMHGLRGKEIKVYLVLAELYDWDNPTEFQKLPSYEELSKLSGVKVAKIEPTLLDLREYMFIDVEFSDEENCDCFEFFKLVDDKIFNIE